ncbi:MAG: response regulator [Polyangiaceae bacterium]
MPEEMPSQPLALIADDDDELRQMVSAVLRAAGFRTETFENGKLLLQRALDDQAPPDVIVSDIDMPRMDGLTAITEIRKQSPQLPIILLSAIADAPRVVPTAKACGATLVISKPVSLVELRRRIERVLNERGQDSKGAADPPGQHRMPDQPAC